VVTSEAWGYTNWAPATAQEAAQPDGYCDPISGGQPSTCDHRGVLAASGTWDDRWPDNTRPSVCEATPN
jgi:hypothetical protein